MILEPEGLNLTPLPPFPLPHGIHAIWGLFNSFELQFMFLRRDGMNLTELM